MTFLGPLVFTNPDATPIAVVGWEEAQGAWGASLASSQAAA